MGLVAKVFQTKYLTAGIVAGGTARLQNGAAVRYLVGAGLNSVLSKVLKRLFNEERPAASLAQGKVDPGFPSSHAHMLFYLAASLFLDARGLGVGVDASGPGAITLLPETLAQGLSPAVPSVALMLACFGSVWRVVIGRHTIPQILAGAVSGTLGAAAWRVVWLTWPQAELNFDAAVERVRSEYPLGGVLVVLVVAVTGFLFLKVYSEKITGTTTKKTN